MAARRIGKRRVRARVSAGSASCANKTAPAAYDLACPRQRLRVALIADTHGALDPRVLEHLRSCDLVVHAGDIGAGAVLRAIAAEGVVLHAVRGNNDTPAKWPRAEGQIVASLPEHARISLPGGALVVVHGDRVMPARRRHEMLRRQHSDARAVVYGHTHRLVCDLDAVPWVLNPGAAGRVRTFGGPSCIMLLVSRRRWSIRAIRFAPPPRTARTPPYGLATGRSQ